MWFSDALTENTRNNAMKLKIRAGCALIPNRTIAFLTRNFGLKKDGDGETENSLIPYRKMLSSLCDGVFFSCTIFTQVEG